MLDQPQNTANTPSAADLKRLPAETPVYDVNGEQIGTLNLQKSTDYLVIKAPDLTSRDLYVPLGAVGRSDATGIYLTLSRSDLSSEQWTVPPLPQP